MADEVDIANDYADQLLQSRIARKHQFTGISATHCVTCDEPIPVKRQEILQGVQTCVDCAK